MMDEVEVTVKVRVTSASELAAFFGHPVEVYDELTDTVARVVGAIPGVEVQHVGSGIVARS